MRQWSSLILSGYPRDVIQSRGSRCYQIGLVVGLMTLCLLAPLAKPSSAQDNDGTVYLPLVADNHNPADTPPDPDEPPPDEDPESLGDAYMSKLLVEARAQLPEPKALFDAPSSRPAADDVDGDGVPNGDDNCPFQPNPPVDGVQMEVCGAALGTLVDKLVFLKSRIFSPTQGLDPRLAETRKGKRIHLLLHVVPSKAGIVLSTQQEQELVERDVTVLEYLPHNTFYISAPHDQAHLQGIVALKNIVGITVLQPRDKVAPAVRLQGPLMGPNPDRSLSFEVGFFEDTPLAEIEAWLRLEKLDFEHHGDHIYRVTVANWAGLRRLVIQDMVEWIDDLPTEPENRTGNAQALIGGLTVSNTLGFRGDGLILAMAEPFRAGPVSHPNMSGRLVLGSHSIFDSQDLIVELAASAHPHPRMVAAIMIADGTSFPNNAGLLPAGRLVSYSVLKQFARSRYFQHLKNARDDYDALLSNNSWGFTLCLMRATYSIGGRYFDRAVREVGITVVYAAGNTRGPTGGFASDNLSINCESDLYSLPHPVAKNDLSVGNWSLSRGALSATSSAGPSADNRLKPDLVAPGDGVATIALANAPGTNGPPTIPIAATGGGTSAAAPVASGVIGFLAESFINQGETVNDIPPARFKAILLHTALDVGPPGPDFRHGYGLIQADRAVRIAEEWGNWGREDVINDDQTIVTFEFDVDAPMTFYKATLAWDDKPGLNPATLALINDLDLTLVSPSGQTFFPFNIVPPAVVDVDNGAVPCTEAACQDRLNNVEMVLVGPGSDGMIEQGVWTATVAAHRLVSREQPFSLVLTPPCPLVVNGAVTLNGDLTCAANPLVPTAVLVEGDGSVLDCNGHTIKAGVAPVGRTPLRHVGIQVLADDVTIRNCTVRGFDVGIEVGTETAIAGNVSLLGNRLLLNGDFALKLTGDGHTAAGNSIQRMSKPTGVGVWAQGNDLTLRTNNFGDAYVLGMSAATIAVDILPGSGRGEISGNQFGGYWGQGIRLRSLEAANWVTNFVVDDNRFEGVLTIPIQLLGRVYDTTVSDNRAVAYGDSSPGIDVAGNTDGHRPQNNLIVGNNIGGSSSEKQIGIRLYEAINTEVRSNRLFAVGVGISEEGARHSQITQNAINATPPPGGFLTTVGIRSLNSSGNNFGDNLVHIRGNGVAASITGIDVASPGLSMISGNLLHVAGGGVALYGGEDVGVAGNQIMASSVGIAITATTASQVSGNTIKEPISTGILVSGDTGSLVDDNTIEQSGVSGIHYREGVNATISNNQVNSSDKGVGIRLGSDVEPCDIRVDQLDVLNNILTGGAKSIEVLCDVGEVNLVGN